MGSHWCTYPSALTTLTRPWTLATYSIIQWYAHLRFALYPHPPHLHVHVYTTRLGTHTTTRGGFDPHTADRGFLFCGMPLETDVSLSAAFIVGNLNTYSTRHFGNASMLLCLLPACNSMACCCSHRLLTTPAHCNLRHTPARSHSGVQLSLTHHSFLHGLRRAPPRATWRVSRAGFALPPYPNLRIPHHHNDDIQAT